MRFARPLHLALFTAFLAALAWWSLTGYAPVAPPGALPQVTLQFDGHRAWQAVKSFVEQNPGRVTGTAAGQRSAAYMAEQFRAVGLASGTYPFTERSLTVGRDFSGNNTCGIAAGSEKAAVLFTAHRDVHPRTRDGAVDNGSGVGAILELARVLAPAPHRYTYVFCALDGEEVGLLGARALVKNPPVPLPEIRLIVNLDMIAFRAGDSLWVRNTEYLHPQALGLLQAVIGLTGSSLQTAGLVQPPIPINTDADQFRWGNLPIVDIVDANPRAYPNYHKPEDTVDKLLPDSLQRIGRTVELLVRQGDAVGAFAPNAGLVLMRQQGAHYEYLPPWRLALAGACLLLVLLLPAVHAAADLRRRQVYVWGMLREQRWPLVILVVLLVLAGLVKTPLLSLLLGFALAIALRKAKGGDRGLGRLLVALAPPFLFASGWWAAGQWPMFAPYALAALPAAVFTTWKPGWLMRTADVALMTILGCITIFPEIIKGAAILFLTAAANWVPAFLRLWAVRIYLFTPAERGVLAVCFTLTFLAALWGSFARRPATADTRPDTAAA
ncbi:MAG TPA: M28 family metallopeptidase [Symbiobacteriaceae bacterium]|nr:M28 family metallopeptidase [Symbiobacteriaceae bacterium]